MSDLRIAGQAAGELLTFAEVKRRTGVDRERLRTWDRRFSMNLRVDGPDGQPMVRAADVALIYAVGQLADAGVRVGDAVAQLRRDGPPPVITRQLAQFAALDTPVVAFAGPLPARLVWANSATLSAGGWDHPSQITPQPGAIPYAVSGLLTAPRDTATVVKHCGWAGNHVRDLHRAVAWRTGGHDGGARLVLVMDLPRDAVDGYQPSPAAASSLRTQVAALAAARRMLQRDTGIAAVSVAAGLLADGFGALDSSLALGAGTKLRTCKGAHGSVYCAQVTASDASWHAASQAEEGAWLSAAAVAELGTSVQHVLALPVSVDSRRIGFLLLTFARRPPLDDLAHELLASFAAAAAAAVHRDHLTAIVRRRTSEEIGRQLALDWPLTT